MANSQAVAADLLRQSWGEAGAAFVSWLVVIATLGSINARTGCISFAVAGTLAPSA